MLNTKNTNLVAVFIDYENLIKSHHQQAGKYADLEWAKIMNLATDMGRVVIKRAYADWSTFGERQKELLGLGFELINTPSRGGKNAADIKIVIDALSLLHDQVKEINHFFLVSGDGDFIDLVHHLHTQGKFVKGMGVSGSTSNYLTRVCDEYVFYDMLVKQPEQAEKSKEDRKSRAPSFDVSEARRILRQALEKIDDKSVDASDLKNTMLQIDPTFNERNYNFEKFKDFLGAQSDLVITEPIEPLGMRVKKAVENQNGADNDNPERLLDRYLQFLAREKVRMTPTDHRKAIIINFHDLVENNPKVSYTEVLKKLITLTEEQAPMISFAYINDVAYQLFYARCIEFDSEDNYTPGTKLWDRTFQLKEAIRNANDLVTWCDRDLLTKILIWLEKDEEINVEVAARLLYGQAGAEYKTGHVEKLIEEIKTENH